MSRTIVFAGHAPVHFICFQLFYRRLAQCLPQTNVPAGILCLLAEEHDAAITCVEAEPLHTLFPGDL